MKYSAVTIDQNLVGKSWSGEVDSVFNAVCNVALHNNEVLVLADTNIPMMPNGIAINSFRPIKNIGLQKGQRLECNGDRISIGSTYSIQINKARSWSGKIAFSKQNDTEEQLHIRWKLLANQIKKTLPLVIEQLTWHPWFKSGPLCTEATAKTIKLLGSHHAPHSDSENLLMHMLGLGPGLTPSGDDFIVGYLAASYAFSDSNGQKKLHEIDQRLRPHLQMMTTNVSGHYLSKALQGEFVESLISLMTSFIIYDHYKTENYITDAISNHGHSSGLDCCFGVLVGSAQHCKADFEYLNEFLPFQKKRLK